MKIKELALKNKELTKQNQAINLINYAYDENIFHYVYCLADGDEPAGTECGRETTLHH